MKPAGDSSHTYAQGECKHMTIAHRKGIHRKGHHPREPAKRADELPVQDSQPNCLMEPIWEPVKELLVVQP